MSKPLPMPLPSDVDVSDMPHMPLHDQVLMKSRAWLRAKNWRGGGPGLGFVLFNLWTAAFRAVPAGSLEGDDDMLAEHARVDIGFWLEVKDSALMGWEKHGDRYWHPIVAKIAWQLWMTRSEGRWSKSFDSWRNAAKRATDKGRPPPDPPGDFDDWFASNYGASASYRTGLCAADKDESPSDDGVVSNGRPPDKPESPSDFPPKRREGKGISPLNPPTGPIAPGQDGGAKGQTGAEGKLWFARECGRLEREFGAMMPLVLSHLQRPGVAGKFVFVQCFKGAVVVRGHGSRIEILMPSKARADAVTAAHGDWIKAHWPDLKVRHATVDEKRALKGRAA